MTHAVGDTVGAVRWKAEWCQPALESDLEVYVWNLFETKQEAIASGQRHAAESRFGCAHVRQETLEAIPGTRGEVRWVHLGSEWEVYPDGSTAEI